MPAKTSPVSGFKGLNNVSDSVFLGLKWLTRADNVFVTKDGAVIRREGFAKVMPGTITGAFTTFDFTRMYIVDGGALKRVYADLTSIVLTTGLSSAPMHWAEVNEYVYFSNGTDFGIISPSDAFLPWSWTCPRTPVLNAVAGALPAGQYQVAASFIRPDGSETGAGDAAVITLSEGQSLQVTGIEQRAGHTTRIYLAPADSSVMQLAFETTKTAESWNASPNALGIELTTQFLDPPPIGAGLPVYWMGRMHLMQYLPESDMTVIWSSMPLGFHLFNLNENFISVPGQGVMLAPTPAGLVIGTTSKIYSADAEGVLTVLAEYGCVPGYSWAVDTDEGNNIVFWSKRGVCAALPFVNLTDRQISVAPGAHAGVAIVRKNGHKRFVAALEKGGEAFNKRV